MKENKTEKRRYVVPAYKVLPARVELPLMVSPQQAESIEELTEIEW